MGRSETICPGTSLLGPLFPKLIVPEKQCPGLIHPFRYMHDTKYIYAIEMTRMYQSRDIVSQGTISLGTRGPRTIVRGRIVPGRPVTRAKDQTARGGSPLPAGPDLA